MKDSQPKTKKRLFKRKKPSPDNAADKTQSYSKAPKYPSKAFIFFKKHDTNFQLVFLPLTLLTIFIALYLFNVNLTNKIQKNKLINSQSTKLAPYPVVNNSYIPEISAKSAIIIDAASQKILFSKNPNVRFSMASTVKIMTSLTALDYYQPDTILTIKSGRTGGTTLNLNADDRFYFDDLMYAMLLPSANDAAAAIADNYPGGRGEFIKKMNEKAKDMHLSDTNFSDPIGLDDDGDFTTVIDVARLGSEAIKNKKFAQIVGTRQKFISNVDQTKQYDLTNLNKLLGVKGVNGIKTGTTEGAGEVLVTSSILYGHTYIIVVMNSQNRFGDTSLLLDFITNNVTFVDPSTF